ncbi:TolB-like protein/class 3 adenylate cyclase/Flp pilus assembly protein TadD [Inquilinus ginsengisoli]|uniref:adenylate/guanylate cyclase domain-containing protein n=1 Tax=Inquilinus ginsengisoli TaxID=363840 RepID=UPI003D1DA228
MAVPVHRRLAAIMAADIVGYSRLMEADEAATLAAIKDLRCAVIDPLLVEHHGRIVKLMGDGAIVEFGSVVDAVACAVAVQKGCEARQTERPGGRRIVFRIGVNLGDVVVEGEDLLGDGVNVAARLEQLCSPGGILISGTVFDQLQGKIDRLTLDYAGDQHVKNIARPVRTYNVRQDGGGRPWRLRMRPHLSEMRWAAAILTVLVLAGAGWWWLAAGEPMRARASIAVIPFDNLGGDEATGRLADGVTDDIITDLARFRDLEVIARHSTMIYKGKPIDARVIGSDLNVRFVLEGSVQREGSRVRVAAQLVDAKSAAHLWSERWDRPDQDVFAIQTELAQLLAAKLGGYTGTITLSDRDAARRKRPSDLNAYDLYLLGIEAKHRETKESLTEAIQLLKRSIEIDPKFARAWTGLSWSYAMMAGRAENIAELTALQLDAARRAAELDPLDAEAHAAFGSALGMTGDLQQASSELRHAVSLNPNSADILTFYAGWASAFGDVGPGVEAAERAIRLNPESPNWAIAQYRYAFFMAGRYEEALQLQRQRPKQGFARADHAYLAAILAALGREEEAHTAVAEALAQFPDLSIEGFAGGPEWSEAERHRFIETMGKANFPPCASEAVLKARPDLVRLPECIQS